jgi:tRNA modification GTPase
MGSLINDVGLDVLKRAILETIQSKVSDIHSFSISERHFAILSQVRNEMISASKILLQHNTHDIVLVSSHLRSALEHLGTINGKIYSDQLLENIFSRFCVGK